MWFVMRLSVLCLLLTVPWIGLKSVIVAFPGHTEDVFVSIPVNRDESKKEGKDQESIQSSTTPDPGYPWEAW